MERGSSQLLLHKKGEKKKHQGLKEREKSIVVFSVKNSNDCSTFKCTHYTYQKKIKNKSYLNILGLEVFNFTAQPD